MQWIIGSSIIVLIFIIKLIKVNRTLKKEIQLLNLEKNKFKHISEIDLLSGLKNRNAFINFARENVNNNFILMYCDIDGLKLINDNLGHNIGDKSIMTIAHILKKYTPAASQVFRMGGDEFLVVINYDIKNNEFSICHSLREKVKEYNNKLHNKFPLSVSIGTVNINELNLSLFEGYELADKIMYQKKGAGHEYVLNWLKGHNLMDIEGIN